MSKKSDIIKEQIAQTKADLTRKLGEFEERLRDDAGGAKETIESAIGNVKATAQFFDLAERVRQKPWLMTGGSVVAGYVAARFLLSPPRGYEGPIRENEPRRSGTSLAHSLAEKFPNEVRTMKTVAFSFLVELAANRARAGMPHLVDKIGEIETRVKAKLADRKPD